MVVLSKTKVCCIVIIIIIMYYNKTQQTKVFILCSASSLFYSLSHRECAII